MIGGEKTSPLTHTLLDRTREHLLSCHLDLAASALQLRLRQLAFAPELRYDADQPRHPAGTPEGGRWSGGIGTDERDLRGASRAERLQYDGRLSTPGEWSMMAQGGKRLSMLFLKVSTVIVVSISSFAYLIVVGITFLFDTEIEIRRGPPAASEIPKRP